MGTQLLDGDSDGGPGLRDAALREAAANGEGVSPRSGAGIRRRADVDRGVVAAARSERNERG